MGVLAGTSRMTVGIESKPIYRLKVNAGGHRLLWWLLCKMGDDCMVTGGWRARASKDIGLNRTHVQECADLLEREGVIEKEPQARWVRVRVGAITG
jgi:hypothetical protein